MSQNGPFPGPSWPGRSSDDEPYAEPADPWGEHAVADPSWSVSPPIPHQPFSAAPPATDPPAWGPAKPPRRNTPIVAVVVVLGLLIVAGLGTTAWLLRDQHQRASPKPTPSAATTAPGSGVAAGSADARFVTAGHCVVNQGTDDQPDMRQSPCTAGTYLVLKVLKGKTTGEKDAENKCAKVHGYTNWFFYDSDLDDLDLVLCLKKQ